MPWTNVPNSRFQLSRNWPSTGCRTAGRYMVWKAQVEGQFQLEHEFEGPTPPPQLPVQITFDRASGPNERLQAQYTQTLWNRIDGSFTLDRRRAQELRQSVSSGGSPRSFGQALLNCVSFKREFNLFGQRFNLGIGGDRDLCFFIIEVPLDQWRPLIMELPQDGVSRRCRARLTGSATFKFGPSVEGWRWLATTLGRRIIMPLLRRLATIVGRQVIRPIITAIAGVSATTAISVAGGVVGGVALAYLTARFTSAARAAGRHWANCGQYSEGYVRTAWARFESSPEAREADITAAQGDYRGTTGQMVRLIGVAHALEDIDRHGGGIAGARAVRQGVLEWLHMEPSSPRHLIIANMTRALHLGGERPPRP